MKMKTFINCIKSNNGMTMTEVLTGFIVLAVFLGGMSGIISFASNMVFRSIDLKRDMQVIQSELYKKDPTCTVTASDISFSVDGTTVCHLKNAEIYEVNSTDLKNNGGYDISEEGLDISIYGIRYKEVAGD